MRGPTSGRAQEGRRSPNGPNEISEVNGFGLDDCVLSRYGRSLDNKYPGSLIEKPLISISVLLPPYMTLVRVAAACLLVACQAQFSTVSCGSSFSCSLKESTGETACWGMNEGMDRWALFHPVTPCNLRTLHPRNTMQPKSIITLTHELTYSARIFVTDASLYLLDVLHSNHCSLKPECSNAYDSLHPLSTAFFSQKFSLLV